MTRVKYCSVMSPDFVRSLILDMFLCVQMDRNKPTLAYERSQYRLGDGMRWNLHINHNGTLIAQRYTGKILRPHSYLTLQPLIIFLLIYDKARPPITHLVENMLDMKTNKVQTG